MSTEASASLIQNYVMERRWPRFKLDLPIRLVVNREAGTSIVSGRGTEISEGGLAVFAGTELNPGDGISVEFTPPYSGKPLRVSATVRNRSGYNYGVEFQSDTDEQKQQVSSFRVLLQFASGHPS